MTEPVIIDEPVSIRSFTSGGKGGYGYSSSQLHRLAARRTDGDVTTCGTLIRGGKYAVVNGVPKPSLVDKYGTCGRCWPEIGEQIARRNLR